LVRQDIAEWPELADLQLVVAHRLDLGVVVGSDEDLHLAAQLFADQVADMLIDRHQLGGGVVWLDPEAHHASVRAVGGIGGKRGRRCGQRDKSSAEQRGESVH